MWDIELILLLKILPYILNNVIKNITAKDFFMKKRILHQILKRISNLPKGKHRLQYIEFP